MEKKNPVREYVLGAIKTLTQRIRGESPVGSVNEPKYPSESFTAVCDKYPFLDVDHPDYEFIKYNLDKIESVDVDDDTWTDDHQLCFGFTMAIAGRQIPVGAWWVSPDLYSIARNYNRGIERAEFVEWLKSSV